MRTLSIAAAVALALSPLASSAQAQDRYAPVDLSGVRHPEWAKDAVIYQINTRQFTKEGNIAPPRPSCRG